MSEYVESTTTVRGYTVKIIQHADAESPGDRDDTGAFIVTTRNRYFEVLQGRDSRGRGGRDAHEVMQDKDFVKKYYVFPLFAYIHSGVALSLGNTDYPFDCQWDGGQIGFVFCARDEWKYRNRKVKGCNGARNYAEGMVTEWNSYLSGDVWGYVIEDANGEHVDSCWGFYGLDYAKSEAMSNVPDEPSCYSDEMETEETLA